MDSFPDQHTFRTGSVSEKLTQSKLTRRITGSFHHTPFHQEKSKSFSAPKNESKSSKDTIDPLCALFGMDMGFDSPYDNDSTDPTAQLHPRGRCAKRFVRSAPSDFPSDTYSTALGPLREKQKLNPLERVFLEAAERGDKSTLARCLSFKDKVNVNCVNMLGRTAIQIAVDNENIELVEMLLQQPGIKIGDALLYAIQEGVYRIVEMLIDHPSITKEMLGPSWIDRHGTSRGAEEESHDFPADISPVILAAVCNQFEILQLLLNRGASIEEPHKSSCDCARCSRLLAEDPLKHTLQRINAYRALASPAWMSLTSPDPILTAFELSSELLHLASRENEFKETFVSLCEQCRKYACDLLDLCRGTGEVVAVLGKSDSSGSEDESCSDCEYTRGEDKFSSYQMSSFRDAFFPVNVSRSVTDDKECVDLSNSADDEDWRKIANRSAGGRKRQMSWHRDFEKRHPTQGLSLDSHQIGSENWFNDADNEIRTSDSRLPTTGKPSNISFRANQDPAATSGPQPDRLCATPDDAPLSHFNAPTLGGPPLFTLSSSLSFDHEFSKQDTKQKKFTCCINTEREKVPQVATVHVETYPSGSIPQEVGGFSSFKLDRLKLAIKHEQKKFVAHPHCQHLLTTLWYDQLPGWRKRNPITKLFLCFCLIVALPILAPIYLVHPHGRVAQLLRSPLIKFINHSASFAIFICLLLIASTDNLKQDSLEQRGEIRGPDPNTIELFILWWVMGFVWSEMKQIWEEGFKAYVRQWWNWLDFIMLGLYLTTVALRLVAMMLRKTNQYGMELLPRTEWPATDPTLLSEALFSIAHIFSFIRIIFLFQVNEHLGPLQISLGNMLIDITKFIFMFLLVISSFACGLHQLYYYYVSFEGDYRPPAFKSLVSSYRTLFWQLFGNNPAGLFEVRTSNQTNKQPETESMPSARTTVIVGEVLLLIYHAMAIIVLINMLIAMMSNSFQTIQNHADTEWKFARSKLWVGYFDEGSTLPPPLNTIVSPKSIYRFIYQSYRSLWWCLRRSCHIRRQDPVTVTWNRCNNVPRRYPPQWSSTPGNFKYETESNEVKKSPETKQDRRRTFYQKVMRRLVRRYIHQSKKTMRQDGVNEDDLLEIKQDISSLRYELREDRKREAARTIGHLEGIKKDILDEINGHYTTVKAVLGQAPKPTSSSVTPVPPYRTYTQRSESVASSSASQPTTYSLSYGRESQNIYDEIKQIALINSAYDEIPGKVLNTRLLPHCTYAQLKRDILQGIRNELREILEGPKTGHPASSKDTGTGSMIRAPPLHRTKPIRTCDASLHSVPTGYQSLPSSTYLVRQSKLVAHLYESSEPSPSSQSKEVSSEDAQTGQISSEGTSPTGRKSTTPDTKFK